MTKKIIILLLLSAVSNAFANETCTDLSGNYISYGYGDLGYMTPQNVDIIQTDEDLKVFSYYDDRRNEYNQDMKIKANDFTVEQGRPSVTCTNGQIIIQQAPSSVGEDEALGVDKYLGRDTTLTLTPSGQIVQKITVGWFFLSEGKRVYLTSDTQVSILIPDS